MTSVRDAARAVLYSYDQIEECKADAQSIELRLVILDPLIQVFKGNLEALREALETEAQMRTTGDMT